MWDPETPTARLKNMGLWKPRVDQYEQKLVCRIKIQKERHLPDKYQTKIRMGAT